MAERPFGHESSAIHIRPVLTALGILAAFVLIGVGVLHRVRHQGLMPNHASVVDAPGMIPPKPRLQPDPQVDIAAERVQKQQMLSRYAWLDGARTVARIPIERAMQLYVQQQGSHQKSAGLEMKNSQEVAR